MTDTELLMRNAQRAFDDWRMGDYQNIGAAQHAAAMVPYLVKALQRAITGKPSAECLVGIGEGRPHSPPWPLGRCPLCQAEPL